MVRHWVGISLCNLRQGAYNFSLLGFPNRKLGVVPLSILRWTGGAQLWTMLCCSGEGWMEILHPSLVWRSLLLYLIQISAANEEVVKGCLAQSSVVGPS